MLFALPWVRGHNSRYGTPVLGHCAAVQGVVDAPKLKVGGSIGSLVGDPLKDVTQILQVLGHGDASAADQLLQLVYGELRQMAAQQMAQEHPDHTLQPTALVHEAYLRLAGTKGEAESGGKCWNSRAHFFAAAAEAMRRILIDHARRKQAIRRGGNRAQVSLDDAAFDLIATPCSSPEELLDLNDAIDRLEKANPTWAQLAKLVVFAGLSIDQAAATLGVSHATAFRHWTFTRAWLHDAVRGNAS
jgi:RNA polymerase sigma factor (TIGR02999 family)